MTYLDGIIDTICNLIWVCIEGIMRGMYALLGIVTQAGQEMHEGGESDTSKTAVYAIVLIVAYMIGMALWWTFFK